MRHTSCTDTTVFSRKVSVDPKLEEEQTQFLSWSGILVNGDSGEKEKW